MGDGQTLAIRLQTSTFYSTRSFSFVEPWFGGRQPVQFSLSLSSTKQYRYDYFTRRADKSQSFEIAGFNVGIAKIMLLEQFVKLVNLDFLMLSKLVLILKMLIQIREQLTLNLV